MNENDTSSAPPSDEPYPLTVWVEPVVPACAAVLLLHGLDMTPGQLAPIVRSLKLPALVALPSGPVERPGGRRAWWPVDDAARAARLQRGPADLHDSHPPGRERARAALHARKAHECEHAQQSASHCGDQ